MAEIYVGKITTFAKRGAALRRSKEKQETLRAELIKEMLEGLTLPETGPYVIKLSQVGGKEFSWESEYKALLTKVFTKKHGPKAALALAEKKMKELKAAAPDKEGVTIYGKKYVGGVKLESDVNPKYRVVTKVA
jgi:hypothetical protein